MVIKPLSSGSHGNSILVSDGTTNLLLDCGIPYKNIQKLSEYSKINAVLLTHCHADHSKGVKELLKFSVPCVMSIETKEALNLKNHNIITLKNLESKSIGTFEIIPFELEHDVHNFGFQIKSRATSETLVYITDTSYSRYKFKNINYFILEINYIKELLDQNTKDKMINIDLRNRIVKTHMSLETAKDLLISSGIESINEIWLSHLSDTNSDAELIKTEIRKLTGKVVHIC